MPKKISETVTCHYYQWIWSSDLLGSKDGQEPKQLFFEYPSLLHASDITNGSKPKKKEEKIKGL